MAETTTQAAEPKKAGWLTKLFGFDGSKMKVSTEIIAGITTFLAMSYILAVNPSILADTGMDKNALFTGWNSQRWSSREHRSSRLQQRCPKDSGCLSPR